MRNKVAIAAMSAGLAGGAIAATVFTPMIGGAQTTPPTTAAPAPDQQQPGQQQPGQQGPRQDREQRVRDALQELVTQGVINQQQADAVLAKLQSLGPPAGGRGGHGGHHRGPKLDAAAAAIGIPVDQLRTELQNGGTPKSLADVARAHNVDPQKVIDAMVAEAEQHLAEEVTSGKLTQQEADAKKAELRTRITEKVNNAGPMGGPGKGRGPRNGRGPSGENPADPAPSTPSTEAPSGS
jgi:polyhydroxyalkanoate synthesis regulator phasin